MIQKVKLIVAKHIQLQNDPEDNLLLIIGNIGSITTTVERIKTTLTFMVCTKPNCGNYRDQRVSMRGGGGGGITNSKDIPEIPDLIYSLLHSLIHRKYYKWISGFIEHFQQYVKFLLEIPSSLFLHDEQLLKKTNALKIDMFDEAYKAMMTNPISTPIWCKYLNFMLEIIFHPKHLIIHDYSNYISCKEFRDERVPQKEQHMKIFQRMMFPYNYFH
ncbi:hypothetical protein Glove_117g360 [Diversispora epigaea]|uniref:Uncharacterized protein n=1 Tax=Diversispora epigaea TaxID=1348612 RepID=A0A397J4Q7_9GLOM|nr:hypothetical protein Glove_117g360 [Diversispora epigaea]